MYQGTVCGLLFFALVALAVYGTLSYRRHSREVRKLNSNHERCMANWQEVSSQYLLWNQPRPTPPLPEPDKPPSLDKPEPRKNGAGNQGKDGEAQG